MHAQDFLSKEINPLSMLEIYETVIKYLLILFDLESIILVNI